MSRASGRSDVQAGLVFVVFGALALGLGPAEKGTAAEMAAGYLSALLGVLLSAVGLVLVAHGVRAVRADRAPGGDPRRRRAAAPEQAVGRDAASASQAVVGCEAAAASASRSFASRFPQLRPFLILPAIVAFALLLEGAGLVIASFALLAIGALAASDLKWRELAVLAVALLVLVLALFVWGLGLPVKVWPSGIAS